MRFDWSTLALQTVNFGILVWLLHRFLYRPVLRLLDARRGEIDKQYAEAHMAEAKAKDELAAVEAERASIAAERAAALEQASAQAAEAAAARRAQAEREAAELLDGARKTLAAERGLALAQARRAALDLGTDIAGRLLAEVPMKLRAEAWLARLEDQDLLCAPVRDLREALVDPQTLHNQLILEGEGEGQPVRFIGSPIQLSSAQVELRRAPPRLGQHTEEILQQLRGVVTEVV